MNPQLRRLAVFFLCGLAFGLAGCGDPSPESLLRSANDSLSKHDSKAAVLSLKALLQRAPDAPEARFLLGRAYLESGDARSAEVELRKALELRHSREVVVPALARAMVLTDQYKKVTTEFGSSALKEPSASADLNTSLAIAYARQGRGPEAQAALAAAMSAAPQDGRARVLLARFKAEAGDIDGAFALIDEVQRQQPDNIDAWQLKGDLLYLVRRDAGGALAAHRQALKIRPDLGSAHASIISILLAQKDIVGAKRQITDLKRLAPNQPETRYLQADIAFREKDFKTAKEIAQELLRFAPENVRVLQLAGSIELQAGSALQATTLLAKAQGIAPNAGTQRLLVHAFVRAGDPDQALKLLAPLLQAPKPDADTLALAAQAYMVKGEGKRAEAYLARAVEANPNDTRRRTALALGQISKGDSAVGFAQLEAIASADQEDTFADLALISAHLSRGQFDAALKAMDRFEAKRPNTAMTAHQRGMVLLARQDVDAARRQFERALTIEPTYFPAVAGLIAMDLAAGKPELARKRLDAVLTIDKNNVRALLAMASLRANAGASKEEVEGLLVKAVQADSMAVEPRLRLIDAQIRRNDHPAARETVRAAVAARPDSPELLAMLGHVQLASGDRRQAITTFNKLAELQPRSPQTHLQLAELYAANKDTGAARQSYRRALSIAPNFPAAERGLIALELAAGQPKTALAMARAVQATPSRAAIGLLYIGEIEASQKNWAAAAAALRASLKLEDSSETAIKLHSALLKLNQPGEADRLIADWTQRHPKDPALLAYVGNLAIWRNDYAEAERIYQSIVQLQPENALAFNNLAVVASKLGKPDALAHAEKANALQPKQPVFIDTLAMILAESDQIGKAIELQKHAVELQPEMHKMRLNLAKLYLRSGQKSLAKSELERLTKIRERYPERDEVDRILKGL